MKSLSPPPARPPRRPLPSFWTLGLVMATGILIALTSFAAGIIVERDLFRDPASLVTDRSSSLDTDGGTTADFATLDEVARLIEAEYYYRPTDPEELAAFRRQLQFDAIRGMTEGLDDAYTAFLPPREAAPAAQQMAGEYEGIGVWVDYPDGQLRIVAPMPHSPAEEAGLRADDIIVAADGEAVAELEREQALDLIRGPSGTAVTLMIERVGASELLQFEVTRQAITIPAVVYTRVPDTSLAHIQITVFGDQTTDQLDEALRRAMADEVTGIVLDLRNNGGGWVHTAQEVIGRFVPAEAGPALYEDETPDDGGLRPEPILSGDVDLFDVPLAVLINGGTASAAEIVAGALAHYDRATLVGEATFGKGSVQRLHPFPDGSAARITFAEWLTPGEEQIQDTGIAPHIVVATPEEPVVGEDPQLDRALQTLTTI